MHTFITNKLKKELSFCLFQFNCYDFFSLEGRPISGVVGKFKCPLKKTQPFCPRSTALNWTGKGLSSWRYNISSSSVQKLSYPLYPVHNSFLFCSLQLISLIKPNLFLSCLRFKIKHRYVAPQFLTIFNYTGCFTTLGHNCRR